MARTQSAPIQLKTVATPKWKPNRSIPSPTGSAHNLFSISSQAHKGLAKSFASSLFQRVGATSSQPLGKLRAELIPDSSWKRAGKILGPQASQTAARLAYILSISERIWGNETDATTWLNNPHPELQGATPLSLLKTEAGGRVVESLLGALEFGFPV
jgi:putative toxin-antitoxin system antitoxin component (TIGR02293 family)